MNEARTEIRLKEKYSLGKSFKQEWSASPAGARGLRGGGDADGIMLMCHYPTGTILYVERKERRK